MRVTNRRILSGCTPLFGSKHLIEHMLYPSDRPYPEEATHLGGGLLTKAYTTLVFERAGVIIRSEGPDQYVELTLAPAVASSLNLARFRIYGEHLEAFGIPE